VVVLEGGARLPEGAEVDVTAVDRAAPSNGDRPVASEDSLAKRLLRFAGTLKGLPSDLAHNHDHYIHGAPRT
jgi:hypothetical protein